MLRMETKAEIREAILLKGMSIRQVAKATGRSRNTIRKMLEDGDIPSYKKRAARPSAVLGPYKSLLETWVKEDEKKPKKARRTGVRMYKLLRDEHGYRGAEATIRAYVGKLRGKVRKQVYITLSYEAGETGQVDFGEAEVVVGGEKVKAQLFVMWLGYSGAMVMQAYPAATQEIFFAGHVAAFEFFGGVPQELWYDNLKSAVEKVLKGGKREEQDSFISFRSHYLYRAEFCNVRSGWEKGGVENRVGYGRRNWLVGAGEFENWAALNVYLREKCRQDQERKIRGRPETIAERLQHEQKAFRALPNQPYPCCKTVPLHANHLSLVTYGTNRYSVPTEMAHEPLTLRAYVSRIEISTSTTLIASHARCWGRQQDILNPYHYLGLIARRPRAFDHAQVIRQWQWPSAFDRYFQQLQAHCEKAEATRRFIAILQLGETVSEAIMAETLEDALACACFTVAGVKELLRRQQEPALPDPIELAAYPHLAEVVVTPPDLQQFNQLLPQLGGGAA